MNGQQSFPHCATEEPEYTITHDINEGQAVLTTVLLDGSIHNSSESFEMEKCDEVERERRDKKTEQEGEDSPNSKHQLIYRVSENKQRGSA